MPFQKGNQLGKHKNQRGGRKKRHDEDELRRVVDEACDYDERVKLFRGLVSRAQAGDPQAAALALGYIYGKPVQRQEVDATVTTQNEHTHKHEFDFNALADAFSTFVGTAEGNGAGEPVDTADTDAASGLVSHAAGA